MAVKLLISFLLIANSIGFSATHSQTEPIAQVISESPGEMVISFTSPEAELMPVSVSGSRNTGVLIPGEPGISLPGMPDLPAITRCIIVPENCTITAEIIADATEVLRDLDPPELFRFNPGGADISGIEDAEEKRPDLDHTGNQAGETWKTGVFPETSFKIGESLFFRGRRIIPITVYPYQYDSTHNTFTYHKNLELKIRFTPSPPGEPAGNESRSPDRLTRGSYRFLKSLVLNTPTRDDNGDTLPRGGYLLVVGSGMNDAEEDIEEFADWKRACGHHTEVYQYDEHRGSVNDIQDHILEAYLEWDPPLEYVCLLGAWANPSAPNTTADVVYGFLEGRDCISEVAVSRLSASGSERARVVLGRALGYQRNPFVEEMEWFGQAGVCALSVRAWTPAVNLHCKWVAEAARRKGFDPVWTWYNGENNRDGSISNWVRDQANIVFMRGAEYAFNYPNDVYPMVIGAGGSHSERIWENAWNTGSVRSLAGPSVISGSWHNPTTNGSNVNISGMGRGILVDNLPVGWARARMIAMLGTFNFPVDWHKMYFTLYGDPAQYAWSGNPAQLDVVFPEAINIGQNQVTVRVTNQEDETPVENALVTLTQPGELIAFGFTDNQGNCALPLEGIDDDLMLSVTGTNCLPFQHEIDVVENRLYLIGSISQVIDDEGGNGDGVLNPGERVGLRIMVDNLSDDAGVDDVHGRITTSSSWVSIAEHDLDFGNLEAGGNAVADQLVSLTLSPFAPESVEPCLEIDVFSGEQTWQSRLPIEISGANLEFVRLRGGSAIERDLVDVDLILHNAGSLRSPGLPVTLISEGKWIQVVSGNSFFDPIGPNASDSLGGSPFRVHPSMIAVPGIREPMALILGNAQQGVPDTIRFELQIGTVNELQPYGPDEYGYFCFDDTDEEWNLSPVYNWIEINPDDDDHDFAGEELPGDRHADFANTINIPFIFRFYGQDFHSITVAENGFIAVGEGTEGLGQYENAPLDNIAGGSFGMIAPFWDNLNVRGDSRNIFTCYDQDGHVFIVQWHNAVYINQNRRLDFQVILYDPEFYPVEGGDSKIKIQYKTITDIFCGDPPCYFSTGICSPDASIGLSYAFNNLYPVNCAPIESQRALLFTTSCDNPRANIFGTVTDVRTREPVEEAVLITSNGQVAITDENGNWKIPDAYSMLFDISVFKQGYNDSTLTDIELNEGDSLRIDFQLLHPEFLISRNYVHTMLDPELDEDFNLTIENNGNGPLYWEVCKNLLADEIYDPWGIRRDYNFGELTNDTRLGGILYIEDRFYCSGANDNNPIVYIMNFEGELVDSFPQPVEGHRYGFRDLAWDGELIWGAIDASVYGMTREGEVVREFQTQVDPASSIAWDSDRGIIWVSYTTEDIYAFDIDGNLLEDMTIPRNDMRIYGLAYYSDDADNRQLYISEKNRDTELQTIFKMNPDSADMEFVAVLEREAGGSPMGSFICNEWDLFSQVFMNLVNNPPGSGGDRIDVWQIEGRKDWFNLDVVTDTGRVEAIHGTIDQGEVTEFILNLSSESLPDTTFTSEFCFKHNADSGSFDLAIRLDVVGPVPPLAFELLSPEDGDTLLTKEVDFAWQYALDPNQDQEATYWLNIVSGIDTVSITCADTTLSVDLDTVEIIIEPQIPLIWWVDAVSGEDTTASTSRFSFSIIPSALRDGDNVFPVKFGLSSVYPNPFNSSTVVTFGMDKTGNVKLELIDLQGRSAGTIYSGILPAGLHHFRCEATGLPSGVYFLRLGDGSRVSTRKIVMIQ